MVRHPDDSRLPLTILIVDDHVIVRAALRSFLESRVGCVVVGEAGDGEEGVREARRLRPDLVLMDLSMPGMDGLAATRLIRDEVPSTTVVVLSSADDSEGPQVVEAGAYAFVPKSRAPEALLDVLRGIAR